MAVLQADVGHAAHHQAKQVLVGKQGRRQERRENVHGRARIGIAHSRQVDEFLDLALAQLLPETLELLPHVVPGRMRRPLDADAPEIVETRFDSAVAAVQRREQVHPHAGDDGQVDMVCGATGQQRKTLFRRRQIAGQVLALGPVESKREGERVAPRPAVLRQQLAARRQVAQRRAIRGRFLGAPAGDEIEFGQPLTLVRQIDQVGAAVELVHDLEDLFLDLLRRRPRCQ